MRKQSVVPGSIARMITAMVKRVMVGEDPVEVANDYGPWEWDSPPDLVPIAKVLAEARKWRKHRDALRVSKQGKCVHIKVPPHACYVIFGDEKDRAEGGSDYTKFKTVLGDAIILDFDAEGRVVGIELVGDKPCQRGDATPMTKAERKAWEEA